ncbi:hypothetical protein Tco_1005571 [Tanacetum coccineum]|uniref:Uncharacterized protein n=1 Tax=Tanacetum coccineum TaxID=301880 RepID=A0ABQ5FFK9_9ASTR
MSNKKVSSSAARSESLAAGDQSLVDALMNKWSHIASPLYPQRQESSSEYLRIKERELELEKLKMEKEERMGQMGLAQQRELKAQRITHERQQLEFEREWYEWKNKQKKEKDLIFYAEFHEHFTGKALQRGREEQMGDMRKEMNKRKKLRDSLEVDQSGEGKSMDVWSR